MGMKHSLNAKIQQSSSWEKTKENFGLKREGIERFGGEIFDHKTYANAGQTSLVFMQNTMAANFETTNLRTAGKLEPGMAFLQTHVAADIRISGDAASIAAPAVASRVNALQRIGNSGLLVFTYQGTEYHVGHGLKNYPMPVQMGGLVQATDTTTAAAAMHNLVQEAAYVGPLHELREPLLIEPGIDFQWELKHRTAVALPGALTAEIGLHVYGFWIKSNTRGGRRQRAA